MATTSRPRVPSPRPRRKRDFVPSWPRTSSAPRACSRTGSTCTPCSGRTTGWPPRQPRRRMSTTCDSIPIRGSGRPSTPCARERPRWRMRSCLCKYTARHRPCAPLTARAHVSGCVRSPVISSAPWASRSCRETTRTYAPSAINAPVRLEPMNPQPPVTRTVLSRNPLTERSSARGSEE